jgi:Leucine-rich repeat (LRR) protein
MWLYCTYQELHHEWESSIPKQDRKWLTRYLVVPEGGFYSYDRNRVSNWEKVQNLSSQESQALSQCEYPYGYAIIQLSKPSADDSVRYVESLAMNVKDMPVVSAYIHPEFHGHLTPRFFDDIGGLTHLKNLELYDMKIGNNHAAFRSIGTFDNLEYLGLPFNTQDGHVKWIRGLSNLTFLNASGTQIEGPGLADIIGLPQLTMLDLRSTNLKEGSLSYLSKCRVLQTLMLSETPIRDADVVNLVRIPQLANLTLHKTAITDEALTSLRQIKHLKSISLYDTAI